MIVGTGNHWVIDALMGWFVIIVGWIIAEAIGRIPLNRILTTSSRRQSPLRAPPASRFSGSCG